MKEYKIISQKDKWFSRKFAPQVLGQALNSYAQQGWVLKEAFSADVTGVFGAREEAILILEREI